MRLKIGYLALTLLMSPLFAKEINITEKLLLSEVSKNPPTIKEIETILLSVREQEGLFNDNFDAKLVAKSSYTRNMEKPFSSSDIISSPIISNSIGVEKAFKHGLNLSVNAYTNQVSNIAVSDATTAGVQANLSIDLYKNLFGRTTKAQENVLIEQRKKTKLEEIIKRKAFSDSVRKIYWQLVANKQSMTLTTKLLRSSERQVKEAQRRLKKSVAEAGEVARYEAQVADRKAKLTYLQYQKEVTVQALKELIPSLAQHNLIIESPDFDDVLGQIMICNRMIGNNTSTPLSYTLYDEVLAHSKKSYLENQRVLNTHSAPDLALVSSASVVGKDFGYGDAYSDLTDNQKKNYSVGINLSFPIGSSKRSTEDVKKALAKRRQLAEEEMILGKIHAYHSQFVKMIDLLQLAIANQKVSSEKLEISLKDTQRKYRQARVSIRDLINDQDSLLVSEQNEIDTKLQIITSIIDYLSVFTETPCALNRK